MSDLNVDTLKQMIEALPKGPFLQAVAIYDCEVTEDQFVVLDYDADLLAVVSIFGTEAGPIVRWFWESDLRSMDLVLRVKPINSRGQAVILSQKSFDTVDGFCSADPTSLSLGPRVYNLNEERRDGNSSK